MLDHIGIDVSDLAASRAFYERALEPMGIRVLREVDDIGLGLGNDRKPYFWIWTRGPAQTGLHIAFAAETRAQVDAFHAAAVAAGGRDNGVPGVRPQYHASYYGGFVLDPDGNNIEAVCHRPA